MSRSVCDFAAHIAKNTDIKASLVEGLDFVHFNDIVKRDSSVFVKPNFTYPEYRKGITTSPHLLRTLLEILKDRAKRVVLGESDGGNRSFSGSDSIKGHDMYEICRETGAEAVNLSELPSVSVEEEIQGKRVRVELPKLLLDEIDCLISVPVLKVHVMTGVSLGIKNLWGCYPDTMRGLHHKNLDNKLALITKRLNPKLVIIDGTYSLDRHGPMYGVPRRTDLLITSNNPVVADALAARVMGIPLKRANHILVAEKERLGTTDMKDVHINCRWEDFQLNYRIERTLLDYASVPLFRSEFLANTVMNSSLTPLIYKIGNAFKNSEERKISNDMGRFRT